jgi:hypothetical protein
VSFLRDEIGIYLGSRRCVLVRTSRGFRSRVLAEKVLPVDGASAPRWQSAIDVLASELEAETWHGARVKFVIADNWIRYELLPWSIELSKEQEQIQHAELVMSTIFGDEIGDWVLRLGDALPGLPRIISAMPRALIEELQAAALLADLQVTSIQPRLIVSYNEWRRKFPRGSAWFAAIDDGSLAALHITNGHCDRIRSVRLSDDWEVELTRIQTMGRLAKSRAVDGPMYVEAPSRLRGMVETARSDIHWLSGQRDSNGTLALLSSALEEAA